MTRLPMHQTRFQQVQDRLGSGLMGQLRNSWRNGSFALLALLLGFYLGTGLSSLLLFYLPLSSPLVALMMVVFIELIVRLRTRWLKGEPPLNWVIIDNFRIGVIYSVVLESFKVGS